MLHPPSTPQANPPPSLSFAQYKARPGHPALHPAPSDNVPVDSLCGSTPHNSATLPQTPPPPHPASAPPAPRTTHVRTALPDTPHPSRSTHTATAPALRQITSPARTPGAPDPPPHSPAVAASDPQDVPPSLVHTGQTHTPASPSAVRRAATATSTARTSPGRSLLRTDSSADPTSEDLPPAHSAVPALPGTTGSDSDPVLPLPPPPPSRTEHPDARIHPERSASSLPHAW